ncbi:glycosyltransferase family 2 protein [Candidatus Pacearchaeota archaeon]|nr:glycosyltransferase family 2 protein [Candidatus Pacearchaeota archaeon]
MQSKKLQKLKISKRPKISVIIPAYNEKSTILELLKKVKSVKIPKEIIVIDDFSKDGTREILKSIRDKEIKVLFHQKNCGKGRAIRTGIKEAKGDIIIIQDADLEYDPQDYPKLIAPIISGKYKVVYGSRFPTRKNRPSILKNGFFLANRILTLASNVLFLANITDEPTCYKVFDSGVLKSINLRCERFEFCPEVTAKVRKKGYKIFEVPIRYYPRSVEEGKKIKWKDGFEALWTLVKYRFVD